jgi:hypothetical protein
MTTIDYNALVEAAYAAGLDEEAIHTDYSGRGMFGDSCLGIAHETIGELLDLVLALDHAGEELDWLSGARQDSLGRAMITYFPRVTVTGAPDTEEDDAA